MGDDRPEELIAPLADSVVEIGKGALKALRVIEPIWTYPGMYNSTESTREDSRRPTTWFVMNREIHANRLVTFVSRPLPDMLKPAYTFGGLSLSQIAKRYFDNWLRTRPSVSDLPHTFSTMVLKTNLSAVLNGEGAEQMLRRAMLFNQKRDNGGVMMVGRDTEDFANVSAPVGSLDKLQSQEQMSAVTGIPLFRSSVRSILRSASRGSPSGRSTRLSSRRYARPEAVKCDARWEEVSDNWGDPFKFLILLFGDRQFHLLGWVTEILARAATPFLHVRSMHGDDH